MTVKHQVEELNHLTMKDEVSVIAFGSGDYLSAFYDFYEIKDREHRLIPSADSFHDALRALSGDDVWRRIAAYTEYLFGEPKRVTIFDDIGAVTDQLEGEDGLAPFWFVFDLMFCEYDDFTLCFISGTNN